MSVRRVKSRDRKTGAVSEFWMVDVMFEHPDGRVERIRKVSPVQTRRGAEQYERDLRGSLLSGEYGREEVEIPTLEVFSKDFLKVYAATNNKPSEYAAKEYTLRLHLVPAFGRMRLDAIDEQAIERFKADQRKSTPTQKTPPSNKTINNRLTILGTLLRVAVEWKKLQHVPKIRKLPVTKAKFDFLTFEEADRLVEAAESERFWQSVLVVALNTGLRLGELLALQWEDCDLVSGQMVVRRNNWQGHIGTPKGGRERTIPLNAKALDALKGHRHLRGPWVWCHEKGEDTGKHLDKDVMQSALRRIRKRAGLRPFEWHTLRHTFASHLVMRGVTLKAVQELLGHASIEMTMRYAHLSPDVRRSAVDVLVGHGKSTANQLAEAR